MKKIINKRNIIGFLIGIFISSGIVLGVDYLFASEEISYDNTDSGMSATNVKAALDELYQCSVTEKPVKPTLKVGDYVKMTPTLTSYTTETKYTGYDSTQTINPSELNIWRVIRVNDDGTYDAVSDKVSSVDVYFSGKVGYQSYIYYLNVLASKYENSKFTVGSRYMGYNGQTEFISDTSYFDGTSTKAGTSWTSSTSGTPTEEYLGRGDVLYTTDTELVKAAYSNSLVAQKVGTTTATTYWLGSRYYHYNSSTYFSFYGRNISTDGSIYNYSLRSYYSGWYNNSGYAYALRPIITLKSGVYATGTGTESDPYVLYDPNDLSDPNNPNYNKYSMAAMCPGCVFAKYTNSHYIQGTGTPNTLDYVTTTSDYTTLNSNYFLGHVLENGYIIRSFACGIEDTGAFCLEGYDASKYSNNIDILNHFFPSCNASSSGSYAMCNGSSLYRAYAYSSGYVSVYGTSSSDCRASSNGDGHCN